jgi:3'(2'), 5'-bisphosphate nucleotidase
MGSDQRREDRVSMPAPSFEMLTTWAERLAATAEAAGRAIMEVRERGFETLTKADLSPVTEADRIAESIVVGEIEHLTPQFPIVAEELMAEGTVPAFEGKSFWLIDALDGTKEFVKRGTDFTVNVALIWEALPVLGIVHAPARGETYVGAVDPHGKSRRAEVRRAGAATAITVRPRPARVVIAGSRSHEVAEEMNKFLDGFDVADKIVVGSSIKFCMVAEGLADLYPRFGPTSEWDTAAGHAVLRAAGGRVHCFDGHELAYKKPSYLNGRFLAEGRP